MRIQFKKLHPDAQLPTRGSEHAAGYDLCAVADIWVCSNSQETIATGLAVAIPAGHYGRIAARSGMAFKFQSNIHAGVVDLDYRGEIKVLIFNHGAIPFRIRKGDRIAQLIIERISTPEAEWVEELPETARGASGFGSSGY